MNGKTLQSVGAAVIVVCAGLVLMLDIAGCGFNPTGYCDRVLPHLTSEMITWMAIPVVIGLAMIIRGRTKG